jgi:hypothetical protein
LAEIINQIYYQDYKTAYGDSDDNNNNLKDKSRNITANFLMAMVNL